MPDRTRRGLLCSLGSAAAVALAGCTSDDGADRDRSEPEGSEVPDRSERWVTATRTSATTLIPHRAVDEASADRLELVMDGAYAITADRELFPLWLDVESIDASTYEATLRDGLRWSDPYGRMTADDWVYYIRRIHQGRENWAGSRLAAAWAGVEVERTGELSFRITLPDPNAQFPYEPALRESWCLPRGLLEPYARERDREGLENDSDLTRLAYTGNLGPYTAERWDRGERFVAARNDGYYMRNVADLSPVWSEAPYFETYEYHVLASEQDRLQALRTASVTTTAVPPARIDQFRGNGSVSLYAVPQPTLTVLAYNQRANGWEPFRRAEVRRACSMAIDKQGVVEDVYDGFAEPVHTFQPPWSVWDGADLTAFGRQAAEEGEDAPTLLADALGDGYGYDGGRLLDGEGEPVTWTVVYVGEPGRTTALASFVVRELERLGVAIEPERVGYERLLTEYLATEWQGTDDPPWEAGEYNAGPRERSPSATDWDLLCGVELNAYPLAPTSTDRFWLERGNMNFSGYVPDAELTALYAEARAATNGPERNERLDAVFGALNEEQPANFLVARRTPVGYRRGIVGPRETSNHGWDRQTWYAE
ncbi:ABC transporter substrate-binding protein [Halalkalicoccus sp. GCM10025322]|uniref:ABC transporter substrate-binding protein n=1 Tax=Halalkalicoccus TaxID=332246 RepID=UPI002F96D464